jgi:hypothetical protein
MEESVERPETWYDGGDNDGDNTCQIWDESDARVMRYSQFQLGGRRSR